MNTMTSQKLVLFLTCLFFCKMAFTSAQMSGMTSSLHQENGFISASVGQNITLPCFYDSDLVASYFWYKQILGQEPKLFSSYYVYGKKGTFYDEYKNNPRFRLDTQSGKNDLIITDLQLSDSATYYCADSLFFSFVFGEGATVNVKGSVVHQSDSETIQPGVFLNYTVQTGTCDGEHSVYWFQESEESKPVIIYTHGDRNKQCVKKNHTQTQSCFYTLPMNLNVYSAAAACGQILFGNGTKPGFEDEESAVVYLLTGILAFTSLLSALLAFSVVLLTESCDQISDLTANTEVYQNENKLHGIAKMTTMEFNRSRGQRDVTWSSCVYFTVNTSKSLLSNKT